MSLRFAEEILLLALDEQTGRPHPLPTRALDLAIAGALLMELAFAGRIDTDVKLVEVLDPLPTDDPLLDELLAGITNESPEERTIQHTLLEAGTHADVWRQRLMDGMVANGILEHEERSHFIFLRKRCYRMRGSQKREIRERIRNIVRDSASIPDPEDIVLICLMDACDLSRVVFSESERKEYEPRIRQLAQMDFIGQELTKAIHRIQETLAELIAYPGM